MLPTEATQSGTRSRRYIEQIVLPHFNSEQLSDILSSGCRHALYIWSSHRDRSSWLLQMCEIEVSSSHRRYFLTVIDSMCLSVRQPVGSWQAFHQTWVSSTASADPLPFLPTALLEKLTWHPLHTQAFYSAKVWQVCSSETVYLRAISCQWTEPTYSDIFIHLLDYFYFMPIFDRMSLTSFLFNNGHCLFFGYICILDSI